MIAPGAVRKQVSKRARAAPWPARSNEKQKKPRRRAGFYRSLACVEECRSFSSRDTVLEVRHPALSPARAFFVFASCFLPGRLSALGDEI